jgi:hypothetical protein
MHKRSNSTTTTTTTATREREERRRRNEGTARGAELHARRIKALFTQKTTKRYPMSNELSIHTSEPKNYNQGVPTRVFFSFFPFFDIAKSGYRPSKKVKAFKNPSHLWLPKPEPNKEIWQIFHENLSKSGY